MILLLIKLYFSCLAITDQILSAATSISHLNLSYFNLWFLCIPEKQRKLPNILLWACFFFVSLHLSLLSPLHSNIFQEFKGCTEAAVPKANREDEVVTAQRHIICCRGKYRILPKWFWHWWVIPPAPLGQINAVMRCSHQVPSVFGGLQKWALMVPFHWGSWGWLPKDLQWLEEAGTPSPSAPLTLLLSGCRIHPGCQTLLFTVSLLGSWICTLGWVQLRWQQPLH